MKSKQLLRNRAIFKYPFCWIIMQSFLCAQLWANDTGFNAGIPGSTVNFSKGYTLDRLIHGQITDEKGATVSGVTVTEKGTTNAATSDDNGRFSITIKSNSSILVFSHIGYLEAEVKVGSLINVDVKMELLSKNLEDVVVVGYGTQKKRN